MKTQTDDKSYQNLQRLYGGQHIATINSAVVASCDNFDELLKKLQDNHIQVANVRFEYVEPPNVVCLY